MTESTFDLYKFGNIFMNSLSISPNNIFAEHLLFDFYKYPNLGLY